jgi:hypothetical protein
MGTTMTARAAAAATVDEAQALVAKWEADEASAAAELEDLQGRAGDELLDDDSAAERLPGEMAGLRDRVVIARAAAGKARQRLEGARRAVLEAEAGEWDMKADEAQGRLEGHRAKVEGLLRQLDEVDNADYGLQPRARDAFYVSGATPMRVSVTARLAAEVAGLRVKANVIRAHLRGERPAYRSADGTRVGEQPELLGRDSVSIEAVDVPDSVRAARTALAG